MWYHLFLKLIKTCIWSFSHTLLLHVNNWLLTLSTTILGRLSNVIMYHILPVISFSKLGRLLKTCVFYNVQGRKLEYYHPYCHVKILDVSGLLRLFVYILDDNVSTIKGLYSASTCTISNTIEHNYPTQCYRTGQYLIRDKSPASDLLSISHESLLTKNYNMYRNW